MPCISVSCTAVIRVSPSTFRQTEFSRITTTIVNTLCRNQTLSHHYPNTRGKCNWVSVISVPTPTATAFEVKTPFTSRFNGDFTRSMHDRIHLRERRWYMNVFVCVRYVNKRNSFNRTWHTHSFNTHNQTTAAVFYYFVHELVYSFCAFVFDNFHEHVTDHVTTSDTSLLIENPVLSSTNVTLTFVQVITKWSVIDTSLTTSDLETITEALDLSI